MRGVGSAVKAEGSPRDLRKYSNEQLLLKRMLDDALKGAESGDPEDLRWLLDESDQPSIFFRLIDVCEYLHIDVHYFRSFVKAGNFGRARRIIPFDE